MSKRELCYLHGTTAKDIRYKRQTLLPNSTYLPMLSDKTPENIRDKSKRMVAARSSSSLHSTPSTNFSIPNVNSNLNAEDYLHRHNTVLLLWKIFGTPAEDEWQKGGLITHILHALNIPHNSYNSVKLILQKAIVDDGHIIYKTKHIDHSGPVSVIIDMSDDAKVIYKCQDRNLSYTQTTCFLNLRRQKKGLPILSSSAVKNFINKSDMIDVSKRYKQVRIF